MRFFDDMGIQVKQLGRSISNICSKDNLRLAKKIVKKDLKSEGYFYAFGGLSLGLNAVSATTPFSLYALSMVAAVSMVPLAGFVGLGAYRGLRAKKTSVSTLEEILDMKSTDTYLEAELFLEKQPEYKDLVVPFYKVAFFKSIADFNATVLHTKPKQTKVLQKLLEARSIYSGDIESMKLALSLDDSMLKYVGSEVTSHILASLIDNTDALSKSPDHIQDLVAHYLQGESASFIDLKKIINNSSIEKKNVDIYKQIPPLHFSNSLVSDINNLVSLIEETTIRKYFSKGFNRCSDIGSLVKQSKKAFKFIADSDMENVVSGLFSKSQRDLPYSLETVHNLYTQAPEFFSELVSLGKKKRNRAISHLNPFFNLFKEEGTHLLNEYRSEGISLQDLLLRDIISEKIGRFFSVDFSRSNASRQDITYALHGYNKHKDTPFVKDVISAFLSGKNLWEFRDSIDRFNSVEDDKISVWRSGYNNIKETSVNISQNIEKISREHYEEAIQHLQVLGEPVEIQNNYHTHVIDLYQKYFQYEGLLYQDAVEHLAQVSELSNSEKITANRMLFETGSLSDFLYVGEKPISTCLGLSRSNGDCLISMVTHENTLPFYAHALVGNKKIPLARSILRLEGSTLIVDDIYGSAEFLSEIDNFGKQLDARVLVPNKMKERLSPSDLKYALKNKLLNEYRRGNTSGLYYSDSLYGRIAA